jgi:hypothetical protein
VVVGSVLKPGVTLLKFSSTRVAASEGVATCKRRAMPKEAAARERRSIVGSIKSVFSDIVVQYPRSDYQSNRRITECAEILIEFILSLTLKSCCI